MTTTKLTFTKASIGARPTYKATLPCCQYTIERDDHDHNKWHLSFVDTTKVNDNGNHTVRNLGAFSSYDTTVNIANRHVSRTQKFAVGDRVSWAGAGCDGTVIELDKTSPRHPTLVRVAWDHGGDSWFGSDSLYPADRQAVIEADTFTRLAEIDAYADRAGCDRAEAVRRLVNMALSHELFV